MTDDVFSSMTDEELRNAAVFFYGTHGGSDIFPLFAAFEKAFARRLREIGKPTTVIAPQDALFYYDMLALAADNGGEAVVLAAQSAEDNVVAALEREIVPGNGPTDEDLARNATDLSVYAQEDPFEKNEDGSFVRPAFAVLDDIVSEIRLVNDDETETSPEEAGREICDVLKMTASARVNAFLMNSREKIAEDDYFDFLYEQMVWDLIGMFLTEEDAGAAEIETNVSRVLRRCGWTKE